jgi:hypothetical protein
MDMYIHNAFGGGKVVPEENESMVQNKHVSS